MISRNYTKNITFISKRTSFSLLYVNNIPKKGKLEKTLGKMGKEEIENFSLRVFIFFLKGK